MYFLRFFIAILVLSWRPLSIVKVLFRRPVMQVQVFCLSTESMEAQVSRVQDHTHFWLHIDFKTSLGHMRPEEKDPEENDY